MKNKSKKSYTDTQDSVLAWIYLEYIRSAFHSVEKKLRKEYSTVISLYNSKCVELTIK